MSPVFSIIMPSYNRAWVLPKALQFICDLEFLDWELIVVDDGSTDATREIVELAMKNNPRVRYVYQENARQAAARQNGLEHATGMWVTYVDTDDEPYPNYLSAAHRFFEEHPGVSYAFAYNDRTLELHDADHRVLASKSEPATELDPNSITLKHFANWQIKPCGTGIFHRRDIITGDIRWNPSLRLLEDIDFVFQLGLKYPDHFGFIPEPLFHQRQAFGNDGVCSGASYGDWADGFEKLYQTYADTWLMKEQSWYPKKVEKYREKQRLFEAGKLPPASQRYFGEQKM